MKISWLNEGIEDCFHGKNYASSSYGFGVNKKKHKKIFVRRFLKSLEVSYIKNWYAKTTKENSMKISLH